MTLDLDNGPFLSLQVWCDLVDEAGRSEVSRAESGWTLVLRHMTDSGVMSGDFISGFPEERLLNHSASYFLGKW